MLSVPSGPIGRQSCYFLQQGFHLMLLTLLSNLRLIDVLTIAGKETCLPRFPGCQPPIPSTHCTSVPLVKVLKDCDMALTGSQPESATIVTPSSFFCIVVFTFRAIKAERKCPTHLCQLFSNASMQGRGESTAGARHGLLGAQGIYPNPKESAFISTYLANS